MLKILTYILPGLLKLLTPEVLKDAVDAMLDKIEDAVTDSDNTIDDALVLPLCKIIRDTFNIPDEE